MKKESNRKKFSALIMCGPVSLWMILLVAIPFIYILIISFMNPGTYGGVEAGFTLDNYKQSMDIDTLKVYLDSFLIAIETTIICLLIAYPFAYFVAQKTIIKKTIFMAFVMVPFMVNSMIRLFSWINLLRKEGLINQFLISTGLIREPLQMVYNRTGSIIGLVYTLLPFMILPLYSSIEKLDKSLLEACSDLGAKPIEAFFRVTLPLTAPGIFAGAIMVFIPALGLFFVTDLMGGSKVMVLGSLIRNDFITAKNWPLGSSISVILIILTLLMVYIYKKRGGDMNALGGT